MMDVSIEPCRIVVEYEMIIRIVGSVVTYSTKLVSMRSINFSGNAFL